MKIERSACTAVGALAAVLLAAPLAWAQPAMRVGHALRDAGEPYSMSGKSQAKAAWVDGAWWAVLSSAKGMDLMRLEGGTWVQETITGGSHLTDDPNMRADVFFDGDELIVVGTNAVTVKLWVFLYSRPSFRLRSGFPVTVAGGSSSDPVSTDVATVAEDSKGRLWVAYRANNACYVKASSGVGASGWTTWKPAIQFGFLGNGVAGDASNCAIVAFKDDQGPKIGVIWADQSAPPNNAYRFRWRRDSATTFSLSDWSPEELVYTNGNEQVANDQLSVVSFEGKIYVAAKSGTAPDPSTLGMDRFYLFVRDTAGNWTKTTVRKIERSGDTATRSIVAIDGEHRRLYLFWHDIGIEGKVTSVDAPNPLAAPLTTFIAPSSTTNWNAQTTHQILSSRTGLLVLADDNNTGWQYWNLISLGTPEANAPVPTLSSITVSPSIAETTSHGQVQFTATGRDQHGAVLDINPAWSANGGSIDSTGLFTAGTTLGVFGIAATQSETGHATVWVSNQLPTLASLEIQPDPATIVVGSQKQLSLVGRSPSGNTVSLAGIPVTWAVINGVGAITTTGVYSAPSSENRAFIRASASNLTAFATVLIVPNAPPSSGGSGSTGGTTTIGPLARIVVTPSSPTLAPNGSVQFSVQGQDSAGHGVPLSEVTWTASSGTISRTGFYVAPGAPGSATITASSGGVSGSTSVTIQNGTSSGFTGGGGGHGGGGCAVVRNGTTSAGSLLPLLVVALAITARRRRAV